MPSHTVLPWKGQLDVMRKDQRPWIKLTFDTFTTEPQSRIGGNLHLANNGKTVAKNITGKFAIEKVTNGEQPLMDYGNAWAVFSTGAIFPNDPRVQGIAMHQVVHHGSDADTYEVVILSQSDWDDFTTGKIFFVAYGIVSYSDFSRIWHWTKYCTFIFPTAGPSERTFTAKNCTDYNDVDDN